MQLPRGSLRTLGTGMRFRLRYGMAMRGKILATPCLADAYTPIRDALPAGTSPCTAPPSLSRTSSCSRAPRRARADRSMWCVVVPVTQHALPGCQHTEALVVVSIH